MEQYQPATPFCRTGHERRSVRQPCPGVISEFDGRFGQHLAIRVSGLLLMPAATLVVPAADRLIVEAKVQPQDIDQVRVGQAAVLRYTTFNSRTTPELNGEVAVVSGT